MGKGKEKYGLRTRYNLEEILETVECHKDNSNYDTYKKQLMDVIDKNLEVMVPEGYVVREAVDGVMKVSCLVTLGKEIDSVISKCFAEHEYLEGMMMNALADTVLFEASNHLYELLYKQVREDEAYLSIRFEPGNTNVDMSVQKELFDRIAPEFNLDMFITEGFMLSPTKSLVYYYEVTEEDCSMGLDHDCSACDNYECQNRKYLLQIHRGDTREVIQAQRGENLLEVLRQHNVYVNAPCNGHGTCGKCKITAKNHGYELDPKERLRLSEEEESADIILACFHTVDRNLDIFMETAEGEGEIESNYEAFKVKNPKYDPESYVNETYPIGIGVDIGTTTLAASLINLVTQEVIDIKKKINPQKAYGADVISRIMYVGQKEEQKFKLGILIKEAIESMTLDLMTQHGYDSQQIEEMVISGNTTMIYLLLDIDPASLAVSPFTTIDMGLKECDSKDLFNKLESFKVTIMPWISAYVGGDIVSGLFANHMLEKEETIVFVDIGTNGEMVLKTKEGRMISAATAAGPAFEGANIKCGMGSINGAICEIHEDGDGYDVVTLGDSKPKGICGSALIDAVALLLKQGHVNDMGYMEKPVMFYGDIGIYPEDIRQVQLAKAAIMAGVDILLGEAGITYEDVDAFYIAGGFGSHMNIANSAYISLISKEIEDKVKVVGNSSLAGSVRYLLEKEGKTEIEALCAKCEYVELSTNMDFNNAYVMGMTFGEPLTF